MVYGPFSLADAIDAYAQFWYWNKSELTNDRFGWAASINGSNFHGYQVSGDSSGWQHETFDLTSVPTLGDITGESSIWLSFSFKSNESIRDDGAFVDEFEIFQVLFVPNTPSAIYATDGKYQDKVYVNWPAEPGATSYKVISSTASHIYGSLIALTSGTSLLDIYVQPEKTYYYRVSACTSAGCSGYSDNNSGFVAHDSVGLYRAANGYYRLRLSNSPGSTDIAFRFGPLGTIPIMGDWDGDGLDTPGVYDPSIGYFRLRNSNNPGPAQIAFQFGPTNWTPIVGDWNGDGVDTVGVYNPANSVFRLRNSNSAGGTDSMFAFGDPNWIPLTGDWNGDGVDTIGIYNPATAYFKLRDANSGGPPNYAFQFGIAGADPISGDWDMDGRDTIGVYTPSNSYFRLRNSNNAGSPDRQFQFGPLNWTVLSGDWDNQ